MEQQMTRSGKSVAVLRGRLRDPKKRLADAMLTLDDYSERMKLAVVRIREARRRELAELTLRLHHRNPRSTIREHRLALLSDARDLNTEWRKIIALKRNMMERAGALLESLNPQAVLERGYSITFRLANGQIIRRPEDTEIGEAVEIMIAKGKLGARITRRDL
jgi:exodeoxyribonuclease VII large subunit